MPEPEDITGGFSAEHPNSRAAARLTAHHRRKDYGRILDYVTEQGEDGATCDQIEAALDMRHQTCGPRCTELKRDGKLAESGRRRPTRSGALAAVLVLGAGVPHFKPSRRRRGQIRAGTGPLVAAGARKTATAAYRDFLRDWQAPVEHAGGNAVRFKYELDRLIQNVREAVLAERDTEES